MQEQGAAYELYYKKPVAALRSVDTGGWCAPHSLVRVHAASAATCLPLEHGSESVWHHKLLCCILDLLEAL